MKIALSEVFDDCPEQCRETIASGVSTDSRTTSRGDVYVALVGEKFDGHDYADIALEKGACAVVAERLVPALSGASNVILVPDTRVAYGQIARAHRRRFSIPVVGVTGSIGKTSTKEMLGLTLSPLGPLVKTDRNENNEIGLPKTLLRLSQEHKAAIVEMGMRGLGQITQLAEIAEPTIGIVTLIGETHIELLGTRDAIAQAKSELFRALDPATGIAVYNCMDEYADLLGKAHSGLRITFADYALTQTEGSGGSDNIDADVAIVSASWQAPYWTATLCVRGETLPLSLETPARHELTNAAGAIAVAMAAGASAQDAVEALKQYRPMSMRSELLTTSTGAKVISDCYNAAPLSMKSALQTLAITAKAGRKIAFLGDMGELGDHALPMHKDVVEYAAQCGLDKFYVVGPMLSEAAPHASQRFATSEEAAAFARDTLAPGEGDVVLIKGSRYMAMEKIVEALTDQEAAH